MIASDENIRLEADLLIGFEKTGDLTDNGKARLEYLRENYEDFFCDECTNPDLCKKGRHCPIYNCCRDEFVF